MRKDDMILRLLRKIEDELHAALRQGRIDIVQYKQSIRIEQERMFQQGYAEIEQLYYTLAV